MKHLIFLFVLAQPIAGWACSYIERRGVSTVPPTGARLPAQPHVWLYVHGQPPESEWLEPRWRAFRSAGSIRYVLRPLRSAAPEVELTATEDIPQALSAPGPLAPGAYALEAHERRAPDCVRVTLPGWPSDPGPDAPMCSTAAVAHALARTGDYRPGGLIDCCPRPGGPALLDATERVVLATWLVEPEPGEAAQWAGFRGPGMARNCHGVCGPHLPYIELPIHPPAGGARDETGNTLFAVWLGPTPTPRPPDLYVSGHDRLILDGGRVCEDRDPCFAGDVRLEVAVQAMDLAGRGSAVHRQVIPIGQPTCPPRE